MLLVVTDLGALRAETDWLVVGDPALGGLGALAGLGAGVPALAGDAGLLVPAVAVPGTAWYADPALAKVAHRAGGRPAALLPALPARADLAALAVVRAGAGGHTDAVLAGVAGLAGAAGAAGEGEGEAALGRVAGAAGRAGTDRLVRRHRAGGALAAAVRSAGVLALGVETGLGVRALAVLAAAGHAEPLAADVARAAVRVGVAQRPAAARHADLVQ